MAEIIYMLCAIMSVVCAFLLYRSYRSTKARLLLWSGICFGLLAANCIFLFVDMVIFPEVYLHGPLLRQGLGAASGLVLLFGLIWELT